MADLLRKIKAQEKEIAGLRDEVRRERAAWTQLNEEVQVLRKENERLRDRMEADIINEVLKEGQKVRLEANRTWWEWLTGTAPPSVEVERVVVVEGCLDLSCCFEMWWASVGVLFRQTANLVYNLCGILIAPEGTGPRGSGGPGFWGPVVGFTFLFILTNLLIYGAMRAADVWRGLRWAAGWAGYLPVIAIWGKLFSKLRWGKTADGVSEELRKVRKDLADLRKRSEERARKRKEEGELRELREEMKNLQAGFGRQGMAAEGTLEEVLKRMDQLQADLRAVKQAPGPARAAVGQMPRAAEEKEVYPPQRRRGPSPMPPQAATTSREPFRLCNKCGRYHAGECWSEPCKICKKRGPCEHRLPARRWEQRTPSRTQSRPVSTCSGLMEERREEELMMREAQLLEEESSQGSSISLSLKPSLNQDMAEGAEEVAAVEAPPVRAFLKGKIIHGAESIAREFLIDSGASANLLNALTCQKLGLEVVPTTEKVVALGGTHLTVSGRVKAVTRFGGMEREISYLVVENIDQDIIGTPGIVAFGFVLDFRNKTATVSSEQRLLCHATQKN